MDKLVVRGTEINVQWDLKRDDFLSLTDIAKIKDSDNPRYIIQNWLRNRNTIEFLGVWETLYNPDFNRVEFDAFRSQAGLNSFVMTPQKWVDATGAIGIVSKAGRYYYLNPNYLDCIEADPDFQIGDYVYVDQTEVFFPADNPYRIIYERKNGQFGVYDRR